MYSLQVLITSTCFHLYLNTSTCTLLTILNKQYYMYRYQSCFNLTCSCLYTHTSLITHFTHTHTHTHTGAFGYFEVTHDITKYCKAKIFSEVGKRTPLAVRFSTVGMLIIIFSLIFTTSLCNYSFSQVVSLEVLTLQEIHEDLQLSFILKMEIGIQLEITLQYSSSEILFW